MSKAVMSLLVVLFAMTSPGSSWADTGLLRTARALDEPRGYCLDIAGFGTTLRLDEPLQAQRASTARRSTISDSSGRRAAPSKRPSTIGASRPRRCGPAPRCSCARARPRHRNAGRWRGDA
jgi:hypothetical protein